MDATTSAERREFPLLPVLRDLHLPPRVHVRPGDPRGAIGVLMATGTLVSVVLKPGLGMVVGRGARRAFLSLGAFLAAASTVAVDLRDRSGAHLFVIPRGAGGVLSPSSPPPRTPISPRPRLRAPREALGIFGLSFFLPRVRWRWIVGVGDRPGGVSRACSPRGSGSPSFPPSSARDGASVRAGAPVVCLAEGLPLPDLSSARHGGVPLRRCVRVDLHFLPVYLVVRGSE